MTQKCNTNLVLRKGAWSAEEDMLLKNCIEKFGEGKWHLVPLRAGLNRCRKSCRLRWLNYLRPNIKKGDFQDDEVDLMLRLHKLLGNRWALIAGRIPGRTANDVKNYWNTHLKSRSKQHKKELNKDSEPSEHTRVRVFKPQPQKISKTLNLPPHITNHDTCNLIKSSNDGMNNGSNTSAGLVTNTSAGLVSSPIVSNDKINEYLDELFAEPEKELINEVGWSFGGFSHVEGLDVVGEGLDVFWQKDAEQEEGQNSLFDFPIEDVAIWDLFGSNQLNQF